jgi:hypothetical protein
VKHNIDGRGQVQTVVVGLDMHKAMAETTQHLRDAAVFRAET